MKHLFNNLTLDEKNRILEQHNGQLAVEVTKFSKLSKSKLGDVKTLISENETGKTQTNNIVRILSPQEVPQSLVDNPPVACEYSAHRGSYDEKGIYVEICVPSTSTCYRLYNADFNMGGHSIPGILEAEKNTIFFTQKNETAQFGDLSAEEVVANTEDKWIGYFAKDFYGRQFRFACFKGKNGDFSCKEYKWVRKMV